MRDIMNIIGAIISLGYAFKGILYYTGRLKYTGEKELKRKERVEKRGGLIIVSIIMMGIGGIGLLIITLLRLF